MTSNVNGGDTSPFQECQMCENCEDYTVNYEIGSATAVDWSRPEDPRLFWVSAHSGNVWSSDWTGRKCRLELDIAPQKRRREFLCSSSSPLAAAGNE